LAAGRWHQAREAVIVGDRLASAACALGAVCARHRACTVLWTPGPAQTSSGNPAGLFLAFMNPDDGTHARFSRAAALETRRVLRQLP
jgi:tRNA 5-methylaminomethyl-2-thiouridine biosynthesis bifunctional protein